MRAQVKRPFISELRDAVVEIWAPLPEVFQAIPKRPQAEAAKSIVDLVKPSRGLGPHRRECKLWFGSPWHAGLDAADSPLPEVWRPNALNSGCAPFILLGDEHKPAEPGV